MYIIHINLNTNISARGFYINGPKKIIRKKTKKSQNKRSP